MVRQESQTLIIVGQDGQCYVLKVRAGKPYLSRMRYDITPELASEARVRTWERFARAGDLAYGQKGKYLVEVQKKGLVKAPAGTGIVQRMYRNLPVTGEHRSFQDDNRKELREQVAQSLGVPAEKVIEALMPFINYGKPKTAP